MEQIGAEVRQGQQTQMSGNCHRITLSHFYRDGEMKIYLF